MHQKQASSKDRLVTRSGHLSGARQPVETPTGPIPALSSEEQHSTSKQARQTTTMTTPTASSGTKRGERRTMSSSLKKQTIGATAAAAASETKATSSKNVIGAQQSSGTRSRRHDEPKCTGVLQRANKQFSAQRRQQFFKETGREQSEETSSSSQEMTTTSSSEMRSDVTLTPMQGGNIVVEQETDLDRSGDFGNTDDDECATLLESPKLVHGDTGQALVERGGGALADAVATKSETEAYNDDDEINCHQSSPRPSAPVAGLRLRPARRPSTDYGDYDEEDDELTDGAALTMADDDQLTTMHTEEEEVTFVVYPLGCCEFDETQLVSTTSTRAIQKCILRLSNRPSEDEAMCWGLDQSQPILMRLLDDHIQFTDINSQCLLQHQPIATIRSWAVDDDNNFAFVIENVANQPQSQQLQQQLDTSAFLSGPAFTCYVFRSLDDDDMSCRVAAKLNKEITRYREQLASRVGQRQPLKQTLDVGREQQHDERIRLEADQTDLEGDEMAEMEHLDAANELSMSVKYIGAVQVSRPTGIDVLNVAIDACLAAASNRMISQQAIEQTTSSGDPERHEATGEQAGSPSRGGGAHLESPLVDAKLHVSPASIIVEIVETGSIIVECRIRYLTFIGISRRDIRWCGFIMQNITNKTFEAHCFECHPTAGHVCEAIQASCTRLYEKMLRSQRNKKQQEDATTSIMPNGSKIRDTLARTLSRIKLTPII